MLLALASKALDFLVSQVHHPGMVEVIATDEFEAWFIDLDRPLTDAVIRAVRKLELAGTALGYPLSSAVNGASFALRELRTETHGRALRIFYSFDPRRDAVLLIGGDKSGDRRFYERMVPVAERIWRDYLAEQRAGKHS